MAPVAHPVRPAAALALVLTLLVNVDSGHPTGTARYCRYPKRKRPSARSYGRAGRKITGGSSRWQYRVPWTVPLARRRLPLQHPAGVRSPRFEAAHPDGRQHVSPDCAVSPRKPLCGTARGESSLEKCNGRFTIVSVVGNPKAEEVKVLLDSVTKFKGGNLPLSDIITHMDWDKDTNENDIAILVLESPVLDTFVPVRLPARYYEGATYVDQTLSVTGWGHAEGSSEPYLSVSNVAVIRNRDCQSQQHQSQQLPWTKMCAVSSGPTPCLEDGGDPVVFLENDTKYTLVGILTPDAQCSTQRPSTITRITEFLDWIDQASGGKIPIED